MEGIFKTLTDKKINSRETVEEACRKSDNPLSLTRSVVWGDSHLHFCRWAFSYICVDFQLLWTPTLIDGMAFWHLLELSQCTWMIYLLSLTHSFNHFGNLFCLFIHSEVFVIPVCLLFSTVHPSSVHKSCLLACFWQVQWESYEDKCMVMTN